VADLVVAMLAQYPTQHGSCAYHAASGKGSRAGLDHASGRPVQSGVPRTPLARRLAILCDKALISPVPIELGPDGLNVACNATPCAILGLPHVGEPVGDLRNIAVIREQVARIQLGAALDE